MQGYTSTGLVIGAVITNWVAYTPTGTWIANSTYTGKWRRVGDTMEVQVKIALAGAPTSAGLNVDIPSGYTIDTSKLVSSTTSEFPTLLGNVVIYDNASTDPFIGIVCYWSTTAVRIENSVSNSTYTYSSETNPTAPITFGSGDIITIVFSVPITEFAF